MQLNENLLSLTPMVKAFREHLLVDPDRPGYHFAIPEALGQPGDPNGAFYANGRYHLMYLYRHEEQGFCWGHLSSVDLVHWRHHHDVLVTGPNSRGCFSGGAFVDEDGTAYISFWDFVVDKEDFGGLRIAVSYAPPYEDWVILQDYAVKCNAGMGSGLIRNPDGTEQIISVADPSNIWKNGQMYYMQAGNLCVLDQFGRAEDAPKNLRGDWTDLYSSTDLKSWCYLHRFYQRDETNRWTDETEDAMCPSFLPLPFSKDGGESSGKYLQLFIAHNKGCQYYIGSYDRANNLFIPEKHGRMSWVDSAYFAPEALIDAKGRHIMWAWLRDDPSDSAKRGWSGVFGLPRVLWIDPVDGVLRMAPAEEYQQLRCNPQMFEFIELDNDRHKLDVINGMSCEIQLNIDITTADKVGLRVRLSDDGEEFTDIYYDSCKKQLVLDSCKGTVLGWPALETAPLELQADELLELTVFIDHSVLEVYANQRQAICRRVYPERLGSGVTLFCKGKIRIDKVQVWEIAPSNPY